MKTGRITNIAILMLFISLAGISQPVNPLFYYPFTGNTNDESGNNNPCTNYGATLTTDRFGNPNSAYYFDGVSNYMEIIPTSNELKTMSDYTLSLWIKKDGWQTSTGNPQNRQMLFCGHSTNNKATTNEQIYKPGFSLMIDYTPSQNTKSFYEIVFESFNSTPMYYDKTTIYEIPQEWIHIVYTRNANVTNIYVNGILVSNSENMSADISDMFHELYFGTFSGNNTNYFFKDYNFQGAMDEIMLFDKGYTSFNIVQNIQNETSPISKDGKIELSISGGFEPYKVIWSDGSIGEKREILSSGTYTATVTDAVGLTKTEEVIIKNEFPDPIAYYPLNSNTIDATGNENTCVNYNAQYVTDRSGNEKSAVYFDGNNSFLEITPQSEEFKTMSDFTISMWYKKDGWQGNRNNPTNRQYLFCGHSGDKTEFSNNNIYKKGFSLALDYNDFTGQMSYYEFLFDTYSPTKYNDLTFNQTIPQKWNFIVFKREGDITSLYENGELISQKTGMSADISDMFHSLYIGTFNGNNPNYYYSEYNYKGFIDEVKIWNKALNVNQIEYLQTIDNQTLVAFKDTLSIKGKLTNKRNSNCKGHVVAFNVNTKKFKPTRYDLSQNNKFIVSGLDSGKYIVFAIPENSMYENNIPSYFPNVKYWQDAEIIDLNGNAIDLDLSVSETEAIKSSGICKIKGSVASSDSVDNNFSFYKTNKTIDEFNIENMPVLLSQNGKIVDWTLTDYNGDFGFENIDYGKYEIIVEYQNVKTDKKSISLSQNNPESISNRFKLNENSTESEFITDKSVIVYPSVTKGEITIDCENFVSCKVVNTEGIEVLPNQKSKRINLSAKSSGIYYIIIETTESIFTEKVIKL